MNANEYIKVRPLYNGYLVEKEGRERNSTPANPDNWDYTTQEFMCLDWDAVVEMVKNNKIDTPPKQI